jgi:hypothetical protein
MGDAARSFFILRPNPNGAELKRGPIDDDTVSRLLVIPKKKLPTSAKEREMGFVDKAKLPLESIKESFISGVRPMRLKREANDMYQSPNLMLKEYMQSRRQSAPLIWCIFLPFPAISGIFKRGLDYESVVVSFCNLKALSILVLHLLDCPRLLSIQGSKSQSASHPYIY